MDPNDPDQLHPMYGYDFKLFAPHLSYTAPDLRQKSMQRMSDAEYLKNGRLAEDLQKGVSRKGATKSVKGVKGINLFCSLRSVGFRHCSYDGMHTVTNICTLIFEILKGNVAGRGSLGAKVSRAQKRFPCLWTSGMKIPWQLSKHEQTAMDTAVGYVMFPTADDTCRIKCSPFAQSGNVKSHEKKSFLTIYLPYLLRAFSGMDTCYRRFFELQADVLIEILQLRQDRKELKRKLSKVMYYLGLFEGFIPETELRITLHQLADECKELAEYGPLWSHWCFPGERALRRAKAGVPVGGLSFLKTMTKVYGCYEDSVDVKDVLKDKRLLKDPGGRVYMDNATILHYSGVLDPRKIFKRDEKRGRLVTAVINYLRSQGIENINYHSPFHRLWTTFLLLKSKLPQSHRSFAQWLHGIFSVLLQARTTGVPLTTSDCGRVYAPSNPLTIDDYNALPPAGTVLVEDYDTVLSIVRLLGITFEDGHQKAVVGKYSLPYSQRVIIKGVDVKFRGPTYAETAATAEETVTDHQQRRAFRPGNLETRNLANGGWSNAVHISSWCKVDCWEENSEGQVVPRTRFGLANYAFRLDIPRDKYLHGVPMADLTMFKTKSTDEIDFRDTSYPYDPARQFIPLHYIWSSTWAVSALAVRDCNRGLRPLRPKDPGTLHFMHFLEQNPERRCYQHVLPAELQFLNCFEPDYPAG